MLNLPCSFDVPRYLAAKRTVDDRALNRQVLAALGERVLPLQESRTLRVLELGCGTGAMVARLTDWGLFRRISYVGVDLSSECLRVAGETLPAWARARGLAIAPGAPGELLLSSPPRYLELSFREGEALAFLSRPSMAGAFDLILAHSFLDLVDLEAFLPSAFACLRRGGIFYFTLNFDGGTGFWPPLDPALDARIEALYHQTMDDRRVDGRPTGGSRTGRQLFTLLPRFGGVLLAAGSSDWVVFPGPHGYPAEEALFIRCILTLVGQSLAGRLADAELARWLTARKEQVARGELVYVAHQLDFCGFKPD